MVTIGCFLIWNADPENIKRMMKPLIQTLSCLKNMCNWLSAHFYESLNARLQANISIIWTVMFHIYKSFTYKLHLFQTLTTGPLDGSWGHVIWWGLGKEKHMWVDCQGLFTLNFEYSSTIPTYDQGLLFWMWQCKSGW